MQPSRDKDTFPSERPFEPWLLRKQEESQIPRSSASTDVNKDMIFTIPYASRFDSNDMNSEAKRVKFPWWDEEIFSPNLPA